MGNAIFWGLPAPKPLGQFSKKICRVRYVGTPPHTQVLQSIGSKGACLRMREIVTLRRLFFSFFRFHAPRYRSARWIVAINGSNDAPWWPLCPFNGFVNKINIFPFFNPKMWKIALHPMGTLNSYNFGIIEYTYQLFAPNGVFGVGQFNGVI